MPSQHRFEINYLFNSEPRAQVVNWTTSPANRGR